MSPTLDMDGCYTYADYATWDDGNRYELIDGALFVMEPGATESHQDTSSELFGQLWTFLKDKPWKVYHPP
ncbi:MAG: Uma2 family endonuclease, partial [Defluviitaleaceae bacterium]|nr:Uma2 family endonuclease [Defluviitaleaceae bacterium]